MFDENMEPQYRQLQESIFSWRSYGDVYEEKGGFLVSTQYGIRGIEWSPFYPKNPKGKRFYLEFLKLNNPDSQFFVDFQNEYGPLLGKYSLHPEEVIHPKEMRQGGRYFRENRIPIWHDPCICDPDADVDKFVYPKDVGAISVLFLRKEHSDANLVFSLWKHIADLVTLERSNQSNNQNDIFKVNKELSKYIQWPEKRWIDDPKQSENKFAEKRDTISVQTGTDFKIRVLGCTNMKNNTFQAGSLEHLTSAQNQLSIPGARDLRDRYGEEDPKLSIRWGDNISFAKFLIAQLVSPRLYSYVSVRHTFDLKRLLVPNSLLGAIWLWLSHVVIAEEYSLARCIYCNTWDPVEVMEPAGRSGKLGRQLYCHPSCRENRKAQYRRINASIKKVLASIQSPLTTQQIYQNVNFKRRGEHIANNVEFVRKRLEAMAKVNSKSGIRSLGNDSWVLDP